MAQIRDIKSGKTGESTREPTREPTPRRLAAIVAGDIAGYSRLMQIDEEGTHTRVKRIERDLIEPTIKEHHGRLVKTTGDGFIAIFDSPVEAVRSSIVIQQNVVGRNASLPKHHWIEYRIGVNLGDVIIETDDVYGDGVDIATRLEEVSPSPAKSISPAALTSRSSTSWSAETNRSVTARSRTSRSRCASTACPLPDPSALQQNREAPRSFAACSALPALAIIAGGTLWSVFIEPRNEMKQASAPVATPAEAPKAPAPVATAPPPPRRPNPRRQWHHLNNRR